MCYDWGESSEGAVSVLEGEVGWLSCPLFSHPSVYNFTSAQSAGHNLFWYHIPEGQDLEQPIRSNWCSVFTPLIYSVTTRAVSRNIKGPKRAVMSGRTGGSVKNQSEVQHTLLCLYYGSVFASEQNNKTKRG